VTDDTAAFQAAVNAGDVLVGPATYLINGTITMPSYRQIQCQSGAILYSTVHNSSATSVISFNGTSYSGVVGCSFASTNNSTPPGLIVGQESNYTILVSGGGHNTFVGDTFSYSWADAALEITGGSTYNVVEYCDFESNAMYGLVLVNTTSNRVMFNRAVDSSLGNQALLMSQTNSGNVSAHNLVRKVKGNGYNNVFLTGGEAPTGFNYGGNNVLFHLMQGVDNYYTSVPGGTDANYYANLLNPTIPAQLSSSGSNPLTQDINALDAFVLGQSMPLPTLNSYVTPQAYGAKGDGVTDDTAAFQSALKAGDVLVPPATYLINGNIYVPSYRNVQCQPGANLHTTRHDNESGIITFKAVSHSSIIGCTLSGSNTATVPVLDGSQWNYLVWVSSSNNIVVVGNTLKNAWGNGALRFDSEGSNNIPSNNILAAFNDFESNGYFGLVTISANNVQALFNRFVDSSCCAESNSPTGDQSNYNVYAYNYMTAVHGNAATCTYCNTGVFFTGGEAPNNFNYGTDQVYDNYITGTNTRLITDANSGGTPPVYRNNQCVNGCR
jgi:hypothetical protein